MEYGPVDVFLISASAVHERILEMLQIDGLVESVSEIPVFGLLVVNLRRNVTAKDILVYMIEETRRMRAAGFDV